MPTEEMFVVPQSWRWEGLVSGDVTGETSDSRSRVLSDVSLDWDICRGTSIFISAHSACSLAKYGAWARGRHKIQWINDWWKNENDRMLEKWMDGQRDEWWQMDRGMNDVEQMDEWTNRWWMDKQIMIGRLINYTQNDGWMDTNEYNGLNKTRLPGTFHNPDTSNVFNFFSSSATRLPRILHRKKIMIIKTTKH